MASVNAAQRRCKTVLASNAAGAGANRPTKLFIGGISRHTTTKMLRDHFSKYGNVLDCVAMRQPDGRSRGFGYVTLDSCAGADRCVSEPQVIDGRVVDLKLAVPEGSNLEKAGSKATRDTVIDETNFGMWTYPFAMMQRPFHGYDFRSVYNSGFDGQWGASPVCLNPSIESPPGLLAPWEPYADCAFTPLAPLATSSLGVSTQLSLAAASMTLSTAPEFLPSASHLADGRRKQAAPEKKDPRSPARIALGDLTNLTASPSSKADKMEASQPNKLVDLILQQLKFREEVAQTAQSFSGLGNESCGFAIFEDEHSTSDLGTGKSVSLFRGTMLSAPPGLSENQSSAERKSEAGKRPLTFVV